MIQEIEFVDGNTDTVLNRTPVDQVPPQQRAVYFRDGVMIDDPQKADLVIPIARVVKLSVDEAGTPVPTEQAARVYIQEFDEKGVMRRETLMVKK
ncbi:MAG: hypothetical protein ACM3YO_05845 [Bacteroidota bacterium]